VKIFQTRHNGHVSIPRSPNCITWSYKGLCIAQRSSCSIEMKKICILPLFHNIYRFRNVPSSPILTPSHIRIDPYFRWVHLFICLLLYIPLFHYKSDICLPWISLCLRHCAKQHSSSFCRGRLCLIGLYSTPSLAFKHIGNLTVFYVFFAVLLLLYLLLTSSIIDSLQICYYCLRICTVVRLVLYAFVCNVHVKVDSTWLQFIPG